MKIISGRSNPQLAADIAKKLSMEVADVSIKSFSSGETYVNFNESVRGQEVFIVQTIRDQVANDDYMELFLLCDTARRGFAKRVNVIIPYYGYARQDKIHSSREPISAKLMADLIVTSGANNVVTVNLHSDQIQGFFDVPLDNLKTKKLFIEELQKNDIPNPVLVSPDTGSAKMVKGFADALDWPMAIIHKSRPYHNISEVNHIIGEVEGKTAILVDDMVDTAGSVVGAVTALRDKGVNNDVYLMASHGLFSGPAVERLNELNLKQIIVTDSLPTDQKDIKNLKVVSTAPLLAKVIDRITKNESVSDLYF